MTKGKINNSSYVTGNKENDSSAMADITNNEVVTETTGIKPPTNQHKLTETEKSLSVQPQLSNNTLTDFFSPLPQEVLVRIYSNLDLKDLLSVWHTGGKAQQRAIETVLFQNNSIEFYPSQIKILTLLAKARSICNSDNNYLHALAKQFSEKIKNPQLSLSQRLRGLKLLGNIWHVPPPDITSIVSKLTNQDPEVCQAAFKCLTAMAPALEKETLATLVEPVRNKINDRYPELRQAALSCLAAMAPALEKETLATFVEPVRNKINDQDFNVRQAVPTCLAAMAPALEKKTLATFVNLVKNNQYDQDQFFCKDVLNCLAAIIPALEKETITTLVSPVINKLYHRNLDIHEAVLACLAAMAPILEEKTRATLAEFFAEKLNDQDWYIVYGALRGLATIASVLEKKTLVTLFRPVANHLYSRGSQERSASLNCLRAIVLALG
uniref:hypothetical protein n=1 Tax=Legionella sp. TaxID=459 RepID=UPI0032209C18